VDTLSSNADGLALAVTFHYCDYADQNTLSTPSILGTIIRQLLLNISIPEHIESSIVKAYGESIRTPERDEIVNILYSVLELYSKTYIILDGLDECSREVKEDVLFAIRKVVPLNTTVVKIFVSSRPEDRIVMALKGCPHISV